MKDDVSFVTSGYDSKARIGYVCGDWESMDHVDAVISWTRLRLSERDIEEIPQREKENPQGCAAYLENFGGKVRNMDKKSEHIEYLIETLKAGASAILVCPPFCFLYVSSLFSAGKSMAMRIDPKTFKRESA